MQTEDIALTMVPALGVRGTVHLLEVYGSAQAVFAASYDSLVEEARMRPEVARAILSRDSFLAAEREMKHCQDNGIRVLVSTDDDYPPLLRMAPDYPHVLYLMGDAAALRKRTVTFVGTRRMSVYGEDACNMLIGGLAEVVPDLCIVSGLAYGIDAAAHRAAIASGALTAAVVAAPLPKITPVPHTSLAREMIERGGAVLSELHSGTKLNGSYFISRNRILAALGHGTVVVESAASGGSLATAHFADGYDRSVMAVPGRITDRASQGTNMLIRNNKARAVASAADIVDELMWEMNMPEVRPEVRPEAVSSALPSELSPAERAVLLSLREGEVATADVLAERSGLAPDELAAALMSLEMSGAVRMLAGDAYEAIQSV